MRDVISRHEGSQQMSDGTSLTTVRSKRECVHPPLSREHKENRFYTTGKESHCYATYCGQIITVLTL